MLGIGYSIRVFRSIGLLVHALEVHALEVHAKLLIIFYCLVS